MQVFNYQTQSDEIGWDKRKDKSIITLVNDGKLRLKIFNKALEHFLLPFYFCFLLRLQSSFHVASYASLFTMLQFLIIDAHI